MPTQYMQSASSWAVVARSDADLGTMAADAFWRPVSQVPMLTVGVN